MPSRRNYQYYPTKIHENSLRRPINSVEEYVTNKTAKTYDYCYSFPSNTFRNIITGSLFTPDELDKLHPTDKNLQERRGLQ